MFMKKRYLIFLAACLVLGGLLITSCSDKKDVPSPIQPDEPEGPTDVVIMYYSIGGGDLDCLLENTFANVAHTIAADCPNMRFFTQIKYSSREKYEQSIAKRKATDPKLNHVSSGEPGCVYRFEVTQSRVNPYCMDENGNAAVDYSGVKCFNFTPEEKLGDASYKMYDPQNLTAFIQDCMKKTPDAQAYILCLSDHGGGWQIDSDYDKSLNNDQARSDTRGILYDDNLNMDCLSAQELVTALKSLSASELKKLMLIQYDGCMMNNLEYLGELIDNGAPLVPYVVASSHSITDLNQSLFCRYMALSVDNSVGVVTPEQIATQASGYIEEELKNKRETFVRGGKTDNSIRNLDYTVTNMNLLPAAFAAIKDLTDYLVKQDVSDKDAYTQAASGCYQFYNRNPGYDVVDYFYMLKEYVFKGNAEYETLCNKAEKAIRACQYGHVDYSYSMDPENGKTLNMTYSILLGCNASTYDFSSLKKKPDTNQGAIMTYMGADYSDGQYFNMVYLADGSCYYGVYQANDKKYDFRTLNMVGDTDNMNLYSWANTYQKTNFDKSTGWSKWIEKNPGLPVGNPPVKGYKDSIGNLDLIDDFEYRF